MVLRQHEHLRVALVHGAAHPRHDGVADYVSHLVTSLAAHGVEAVAVPVPGSSDGLGRPHGWLSLLRTRREIRRIRPDLVHVQFAPSAYRFSPIAGLLPWSVPGGIPLVTTLHEYGWWTAVPRIPDWAWRGLERIRLWDRESGRLGPASAEIVVTNDTHARAVAARLGRVPVRIPLAPNVEALAATPADPGARQRVRQRVRQRLGLPPDAVVLVFFGFVHPVKGVRYLIEALATLRDEYSQLHLLVVGGFTSLALPAAEASAFRAELGNWACECGVADAVTFTGHLSEPMVSETLYAADLAVLPFTAGVTVKSGALLSMLSHRLPVVITGADPPDPQLIDGETAIVVPSRRDAGALAEAVRGLLNDPLRRRAIARGGHLLAEGRTWPIVAAAHRDLYRRVLGLPRLTDPVTAPGASALSGAGTG